MNHCDRRSFLTLAGQSALALSAFGSLSSFADILQKDDHFFVVLKMTGGWDITLGLDPWTQSKLPDANDMFIEYGMNDIYKLNTLALGPAALSLKPFASQMATINGIFLSDKDNGHTASLNYMLTGKSGSAANLEFELAHAGDRIGNFGVLTNSDVSSLQRNIATTGISGIREAFLKNEDGSSLKNFLRINKPDSDLAQAQGYMAKSSNSMRELFNLLKKFDLDQDPELAEAKMLAASFLTGGSFNGHLDISTGGIGLDTHANHEKTHLEAQKVHWNKIVNLLNFFKKTPYKNSGESLFDRTTFLVVSDFSRTPSLNTAKGKDHNPMTNSALLIGRGIKGGQNIGESKLIKKKNSTLGTSYHIAKPFDFETSRAVNQPIAGAKFITPESIAMTLAKVFKVDMNKFDSFSKEFKPLNSIIS